MPINFNMSITGSTATSVSQGSATFSFGDSYEVGNYEDGPAYMVVPSGTATISGITPAQTTLSGDVINGAAKNFKYFDTGQPFDERAQSGALYDATEQFTSGSVTAGDIIIKAVSNTDGGIVSGDGSTTRFGLCDEWAVLFVVSEAPAAGTFAPAATNWSGRGTPAGYSVDVSSFVSGLPSYSDTGQTIVPYDDLIAHIGQFAPVCFWRNLSVAYQEMLPRGFGNTTGSGGNYGGDVVDWINPACQALISDGYTTSQKETLAKWLISHGIQWGDPLDNVTPPSSNGGHYQFHLGPIAIARQATSRSNATVVADMGINWAGAFEFTTTLVNKLTPHDSLSDPFIYRRRAVTAVSGTTISVEFERSGSTGDPAQVILDTGMTMVRESDGATANITDATFGVSANTTSSRDIGIDAQPGTAFAVDDVVYMPPSVVPVSGDFDWTINGLSQFNNYNPSGSASYRTLNRWLGQVILIKAAGWSGDFDAVLGYVERAQGANDPAGDDFPPHHATTWESEFWDDHGGTIFA